MPGAEDDWTDRIIGARMTVDSRFSSTVAASDFSRQEWGLIMAAVEFDIEHPDNDERAELIADTSDLPAVMPELHRVRSAQSQMGAPGGPGPEAGDAGGDGGGGFLGSVKEALGLGGRRDPHGGADGGVDEERTEAAEALVDGYATELQEYLEEEGRWREVRAAYRESTARE